MTVSQEFRSSLTWQIYLKAYHKVRQVPAQDCSHWKVWPGLCTIHIPGGHSQSRHSVLCPRASPQILLCPHNRAISIPGNQRPRGARWQSHMNSSHKLHVITSSYSIESQAGVGPESERRWGNHKREWSQEARVPGDVLEEGCHA